MAITQADLTALANQEAYNNYLPAGLFTPFILDAYQANPSAFNVHPEETVKTNAQVFAGYLNDTPRVGFDYGTMYKTALGKWLNLQPSDPLITSTVDDWISKNGDALSNAANNTTPQTPAGAWDTIKNFFSAVNFQRTVIVILAIFLIFLGLRGLMGPSIAVIKKGIT